MGSTPNVMKSLLTCTLVHLLLLPAGLGQTRYPCDSIPKLLRMGADAVIRSYQKKVTYLEENKALIDVKLAVTLLNENAEHLLYVPLRYDKLAEVTRVKANAYDENGTRVWFLKKTGLYDIKDFSGPEYLDDSRVKLFRFPALNYPYTVEYSFRYTTEDLLLIPVDYFEAGTAVSIEKSGIQYVIPKKMPFRYACAQMRSPTDSVWIRDNLVLTWQEENLPARKQRTYAPDISNTLPALYATVERFNLKGYAGELTSWRSYGAWINKINSGRDVLSPEYARQVAELVQHNASNREKIKILYEYLQKKTRYFSISFGIGGTQPVPADQVALYGYGDCKALSNYMKAMLKVIGIESYYSLIKAGEGENINPDFPSDQFNHVILCVPDNQDTIWLECTDQTAPFGYLGSFTSDRYALLITPDGGKLQRTPAYGLNDNIVNTRSEILLYGSGDADVKIRLHHSGLRYEAIKSLSEAMEDERKAIVAGLLNNAAIALNKERYTFGKTTVPFGIADLDVHLRDLSAKGGNRLFICPSLLARFSFVWNDPTEIELAQSYQRNDTVRLEIPLGYKVDFLPGNFQLNSSFGRYTSHISHDNKFVYFTRNLEILAGKYPKDYYPEFHRFITDIALNDNKMLILKADR